MGPCDDDRWRCDLPEAARAGPHAELRLPAGPRLRPREGRQPRHARRRPPEADVPAHARAHAGLAVLPGRRPADLGRHAVHQFVWPHRPAGQRSEGDVLLAHPASGRAARRHALVPRPQLRRALVHDRRREAREPVHAVPLARRLPARDGRRARVIAGRDFAERLRGHGFDFFTGVPCSLIEDLIAVLEQDSRAPYVAAVREDAAVGVAAGAWFGGRRPVVLMQNSGLGTSLNALASLSLMYGLPVLLVVTWRGYEGKDAPEHILTGQITPKLLELLGIPFRVLAGDSLDGDLAWAAREMTARMQPVALVVPPKVVEAGGRSA